MEHVNKSAKHSFCIISRFHAELSKLWPRTRQMRLLPPQPYEKSLEAGHGEHSTCFTNQAEV